MTARIIRLIRTGGSRRPKTDDLFFDSVNFTATCPECKDPRSQVAYSHRALHRLLSRNHPIEAYCVTCDARWAISAEERRRLATNLDG